MSFRSGTVAVRLDQGAGPANSGLGCSLADDQCTCFDFGDCVSARSFHAEV